MAVVDEDGKVLFYNFGTTLIKATAIVNGQKQTVSCPVTLLEEETREARFEKAWANTGAESVANIIDGELSTNWQSEYKTEDAVDADQFMVSTENPAVVTVQLPEGRTSQIITNLYSMRGQTD